MNFFEAEIAKYDRRLKKIRENPDPTKLRSNALIYEVERDFRNLQLDWWLQGRPFSSGYPLEPLLAALGFQCIDIGMIGDRVEPSKMGGYFDYIRSEGYPDSVCDRIIVNTPMIKLGDIPPPSLIIILHSVCDNIMHSYNVLASLYDVPVYRLDVPFEPTPEALDYVTAQLEDMIKFIEKNLKVEFKEEVMIKLQEADQEAYGYFRDIYELKKRVPCPLTPRDSFREERFPSFFCDLKLAQQALEYLESFRDELYERAEKGIGVMPEEKLRLMWTVTGPLFTQAPYDLLLKKGVSLPVYMHGSTARNCLHKYGLYGDKTEYGRALSPLEEQSRMVLRDVRTWAGLAGGWEEDCIDICRDQKIDAVVNFIQLGCPQTIGLATLLSEALMKEIGIPTLHIEGRGLDPSSYTAERFEGELEDFVDMCLARKASQS